jgi:hypothetical protein
MPFVHVESSGAVVAEGAEHPHPADSQDDFLAEAISGVSSVQKVGELAVGIGVLGEVGIEEVDGQDVAADTLDLILPRTKQDVASLEIHGHPRAHLLQEILDHPLDRLLALPPVAVEALIEVALAVKETHRDHRQSKVGRRADGIPGEDTEPTRVGGHRRLEPYFHREIGNHPALQ